MNILGLLGRGFQAVAGWIAPWVALAPHGFVLGFASACGLWALVSPLLLWVVWSKTLFWVVLGSAFTCVVLCCLLTLALDGPEEIEPPSPRKRYLAQMRRRRS